MQSTAHVLGLALVLIAFMGPVAAMDQSATEETNCLMACDANQENCGHASAGKHRSPAPGMSREALMSRGLRPAANFSQMDPGVFAKERQRQLLGDR